MKITAVRTHLLEHRLDTPFESASMRFDRRAHILVEIECDDGTVGWGECLGPARPNAAVVQAYSGWLIGQDPRQTEKIWAVLYNALRDQGQRGLSLTALSGIDIALWDIKGKHYGASISMLLGGRWRESVRAYATGSFKRDKVDRVSDNASEMAERRAEGFHACKIKIGFGIEEDLRVIAAVREAIGPDMRLMIDANHGYTVTEAITLGNRAAGFGIDWFEEPVVPEQLDAYARVRAGQPIPVAGGETWHGRYGMWQALSAGAVDILQPDLCGCGGFSEIQKIATLATLHGVRIVPHVWGTGVQIAAALQFMAAMTPDPVRVNPIEPIMEFDRTHNPFRQAVLREPLEAVNGIVTIPDGPGLGIEINRDALTEFRMPDP
ncbi:D-galactarolactone cycloisomerase [Agrobacterium fabrum]|jgi:D-galactarolactone cycloisomerase|uniref:D-galactarolactone cycloisomerase n=1 Tax=Agrobacterium fabrum TaxID=1176649 RepID=UPI0009B99889|nr:D-galactarolactone cycloisomerase [Agrobacterium fabrum]MCR6725500.1 D-galactarolactone cycloisomerase [Agrobacterium fabrum]UXT58996.1 mandelate racemase/muconate lactonizing enzyme family protein [Agrobacterium fabrum]WIE30468.1 D-galactarolactone cycloisomerase [Agrobacterium fabrum]WIE46428.1 D-galactarolactone cycloisomerase [Agrobacterium fabrum]CAH0294377.1 D-galactarolactone cycloisomerase [Agrobacterium fabrum]